MNNCHMTIIYSNVINNIKLKMNEINYFYLKDFNPNIIYK